MRNVKVYLVGMIINISATVMMINLLKLNDPVQWIVLFLGTFAVSCGFDLCYAGRYGYPLAELNTIKERAARMMDDESDLYANRPADITTYSYHVLRMGTIQQVVGIVPYVDPDNTEEIPVMMTPHAPPAGVMTVPYEGYHRRADGHYFEVWKGEDNKWRWWNRQPNFHARTPASNAFDTAQAAYEDAVRS